MKIRLATFCLYFMSIMFFAWALPTLYDLVFTKTVSKTHIFYSPTAKVMVYTEQLLSRDMAAEEKSETHHSDVVYKNEKGQYFTREEFEALLPFIYYRNMEMRGLLPLEIDGRSFDRQIIQAERRVLELPARLISGKQYEQIFPLIESNPGQVALVLPADRFRLGGDNFVMVDSDANQVDPSQSEKYSKALQDQGFTFPIKGIWGNFSTFKAYEGGVFLLDSFDKTFHLIRRDNEPIVQSVDFPEDVVPQTIVVSETKERKYLGLVLDTKDRIHLLSEQDFALTHIPTPGYVPERMDFKLVMDPLYLTAIFSDARNIKAIAFANNPQLPPVLEALHDFTHEMSQSKATSYSKAASLLFPFAIKFQEPESRFGVFQLHLSPLYWPYSLILGFVLAIIYVLRFRHQRERTLCKQGIFIVFLGLYILIPFLLMEQYKDRQIF